MPRSVHLGTWLDSLQHNPPPQSHPRSKDVLKESQASKLPNRSVLAPVLSLACFGSLGLPGVQTLPLKNALHWAGREGRRELEQEEGGKRTLSQEVVL